jgi:hypothetical protein
MQRPYIHPHTCSILILLFTIATITAFILLLLLLFCYYHHYKIVATDIPLRASLFPGAAELTTHLLRLINILWLPLYRINKFGFYFLRRLLRSLYLWVITYHAWFNWTYVRDLEATSSKTKKRLCRGTFIKSRMKPNVDMTSEKKPTNIKKRRNRAHMVLLVLLMVKLCIDCS